MSTLAVARRDLLGKPALNIKILVRLIYSNIEEIGGREWTSNSIEVVKKHTGSGKFGLTT